jgi:hypothetical protein
MPGTRGFGMLGGWRGSVGKFDDGGRCEGMLGDWRGTSRGKVPGMRSK